MMNFLTKFKQIIIGIHQIQFPHYHRKFTAPIQTLTINLVLLLILILLIFLNLLHNLFFGFNEEKRLKRNIVSFPFVSTFHEELGAYYTEFNLSEAGKEYLLADSLDKEAKPSEEGDTQVLGSTVSPFETWLKLTNYNKTVSDELTNWKKIGEILPDYTYSHLKKAFLYEQLGNTIGVRSELQNLEWEYNNIPEVINLKNKYGFR